MPQKQDGGGFQERGMGALPEEPSDKQRLHSKYARPYQFINPNYTGCEESVLW